MGRYYHLSKKITEKEAEEILREMRELEDVESVEMEEDYSRLKVKTKDELFAGVMGNAVNICSRVARGTELSFAGFAYEE